MDKLDELESRSIYIIREAYYQYRDIALLWSVGKDSTVLLWLARKAFLGKVPFPLIHIDTSYKIPEMIEWRDRVAQEWNLDLVVAQKELGLLYAEADNDPLDRQRAYYWLMRAERNGAEVAEEIDDVFDSLTEEQRQDVLETLDAGRAYLP